MSTNLHDVISSLQFVQSEADRVPELAARIRELEATLADKNKHIDSLEFTNLQLGENNDSLTWKVRSLEVERDQAGFRASDAERKLAAIQSVVGHSPVQVESASADQVAEPHGVSVPVDPTATTQASTESRSEPTLAYSHPAESSGVAPSSIPSPVTEPAGGQAEPTSPTVLPGIGSQAPASGQSAETQDHASSTEVDSW